MHKFFLLICLLALWAFSGVASSNFRSLASPKNRYCDFTIKSTPKTKGSTTTFNGFVDKITGTAATAANTNLAGKKMAGDVGSIDYEGSDCGCMIRVYSQPNLSGSYLSFNLTGKTTNTLAFSNGWAKKIQSYKFYYYN